MGAQGSGRRPLKPTSATLPAIGNDEAGVGTFVDAVAQAVATDTLDPRKADTLKDLARTKLASLRQSNERRRIDELRQIIDRAERLRADGLRHTSRCRQHRDEPRPGAWDPEVWRTAVEAVGRVARLRSADQLDDDDEGDALAPH